MKNFVRWLIPVLFIIGILIVIGTTYNKLLDAVNYKPYSLDTCFVISVPLKSRPVKY